MSDKLTTAYRRLTDRLPRRRRLEAWSHIMSWLAVSLTALMVGTAQALETNPVSAALIQALGMRGFAILATVGVAVAFRLIEQFDSWRSHRLLGSVVATVLTIDAGGNVFGVLSHGLPESIAFVATGITSIGIAVVAISLYGRLWKHLNPKDTRPRHVWRILVVAAIISMSPILGGMSPTGVSSGQTSDISGVFEGFEESDPLSDWTGDTGRYARSTTIAKSGDASLVTSAQNDDTVVSIEQSVSDIPDSKMSMWVYGGTDAFNENDYLQEAVQFELKNGNGNKITNVQIRVDGAVDYNSGSGETEIAPPGSAPAETWLKFEITEIDYSAQTYDFRLVTENGTEIATEDGIGFATSATKTDASAVEISRFDGSVTGTIYHDDLAYDTSNSNSNTVSHSFTVDDYTDDLAYQSPDELTVFRPDGSSATATFNDGKATLRGFDCSKRYTLLLRDGGAYWKAEDVAVPCNPSTVTLIPGFDSDDTLGETPTTATATDSEINEIQTRFERIEREYNGTTEPRYEFVFDPPGASDQIDYNITGPNGTEYYNGSFEPDRSSDYYRVELPENATGGVDNPQLNYEGQFATGEGFNGSIDLSGDGAIFGPVGGSSSDGSGGDPTLGIALVGGVAYLGYRRFGDGQIGQAASQAASAVSRRLGP